MLLASPLQDSMPGVIEEIATWWGLETCDSKERHELTNCLAKALMAGLGGTEQRTKIQTAGLKITCTRLVGSAENPRLIHLLAEPVGPILDSPRWLSLRIVESPAERDNPPSLHVRKADWSDWNLRGLFAPGLILEDCKLVRLCLDDADVHGSQWLRCSAVKASMQSADMRGAHFVETALHKVGFDHSNCTGAIFEKSNLCNTQLAGAQLMHARLLACSLLGANFSTDLSLTELQRCVISPSTRLPPGVAPRRLHHPDDVLRPGSTVIYPKSHPSFVDTFIERMDECGVQVIEVDTKDGCCWLRDVCFKAGLEQEREPGYRVLVTPDHLSSLRRGDIEMFEHRHHSQFWRARPKGPVPLAIGGPAEVPREDRPFNLLHVTLDQGLPAEVQIDATSGFESDPSDFIPGGNIMVIRADLCVVGNDALIYSPSSALQPFAGKPSAQKIAASFPRIGDDALRTRLWLGRKQAKHELRRLLGIPKLVLIPHCLFQIDMEMAYLGNNCMVLHSYQETVSFIKTYWTELREELGSEEATETLLKCNEALALRYEESVINVASGKLERSGIQVIKACTMLISEITHEGLPEGVFSLFANGIARDHGDGVHFSFYTADAPNMRSHKRYFSEICEKVGVQVDFLESSDGFSPAALIEQHGGGLRCLTNTNVIFTLDHHPAPTPLALRGTGVLLV